ncbi:MAG: DNA recombination protein RmuC, partial [Phycisphaerales bacterium]|nr:DNA recombination protein RmuC [Phycisphaerales bacterium]
MSNILLMVQLGLTLVTIVLLVLVYRRARAPFDTGLLTTHLDQAHERTERLLREEIAAMRKEAQEAARQQRDEASKTMEVFRGALTKQLDLARSEATAAARATREESTKSVREFGEQLSSRVTETFQLQNEKLETFAKRLADLIEASEKRGQALRTGVEQRLDKLREENAKKLDEMRSVVDEKLQGTLEKRLGESFKVVSERLEQVHKGLGEMQSLANGVGDLKRVMTNVKTRGTWGEFQLGAILEQILSPAQYEANVATRPDSGERVEYAIRLPGRNQDDGSVVYLPIDAKFPSEDYQRLIDAQDAADADGVAAAKKQLESSIKASARDICTKYLSPPRTTDFAIMFLPTEGLYAEVVRSVGLIEHCQREWRVVVAGPTTLAAILNSLQMGFRTLAIQQRSSEVWEILGAVKTEFGKFGQIISKVKKKLSEAANTVDEASVRTRAMNRKLKAVEALPARNAQALLGLP